MVRVGPVSWLAGIPSRRLALPGELHLSITASRPGLLASRLPAELLFPPKVDGCNPCSAGEEAVKALELEGAPGCTVAVLGSLLPADELCGQANTSRAKAAVGGVIENRAGEPSGRFHGR